VKEKAPLDNPFIMLPRGVGGPSMVVGQSIHVSIAPLLCPKGVVVELKR
jgi:hypothetical protein